MFVFSINVFTFSYFFIAFLFWVANEISVIKTTTTKGQNVSKEAIRNNNLLGYGTFILMFLMLALFFYNVFFNPFLMVKNELVSIIGSSIAIFGVLMRIQAILTLKEHFDGLIQIKEEQKLIQSGLYKYFRHPSYTGSLIAYFGLGLASMNVLSFALLPTFLYFAYKQRIEIEEKVLVEGFGKDYILYQENTWALIPEFKRKRQKKDIKKSV